jgi:hypothetical protein
MNRRSLLRVSGFTALGLLAAHSALGQTQSAIGAGDDDTVGDELVLTSAITRNHGHEFATLTLTEIVLLLQQIHAQNETPVVINIKGKSSHPHAVELNTENLVQLLASGKVEIESSVDSGHAHTLSLKLIPS